MTTIILIAIISLVLLLIFHELGHFLLAKLFGVRVPEFGLGYPPRIVGKKIGETLYSLNLIPFGAFVKIHGQEKKIDSPESFSSKPLWQKSLIILGGVMSFWLIAAILLSVVMYMGVPTVVEDAVEGGVIEPKVQVVGVASDSLAEQVGLEIGDVVKGISVSGTFYKTNKVGEVQKIVQEHKGEEISLKIARGAEEINVVLIPRVDPPEGEGAIGVALLRTALKSYPWYLAPVEGIKATGGLTLTIIQAWGMTFSSLFGGEGLPAGVEVRGVVGIFELFIQAGALGIAYFLQLIAIIAVHLALINALPIPALDGGWLAFLVIEKITGKPLNQKIVQGVSGVFFILLIILMVWITINDVARLF